MATLILNKITVRIIISLLKIAAKQTDNTIDDQIVEAVEKGFGKK